MSHESVKTLAPSVAAVITSVGEMVAIKRQFDDGKLSVDKLADRLWEKLVELQKKHEAIETPQGEMQ